MTKASSLVTRVEHLHDKSVPLADKVTIALRLREGSASAEEAASLAGMSASHFRNFLRLVDLDPACKAVLREQGHDASFRRWVAIAAMAPEAQRKAAKAYYQEWRSRLDSKLKIARSA